MLRNSQYIYDNIIIADEKETTKQYCKKAQVGVDLSIKKVYRITKPGLVRKDKTFVPEYEEIKLLDYNAVLGPGVKGWFLQKGTYIIDLNEGAQFGKEDTGIIIKRSSLNRCGVGIESAVWDPGFTTKNEKGINTISVRLVVDNEWGFYIEENARVAQLLVFQNELTELYSGQFQGGRKTSNL